MQFAAWSISVVLTLVNSSMLPIPSPVTSIVDVVDVTGGTLQAILQPILHAMSNSNFYSSDFSCRCCSDPSWFCSPEIHHGHCCATRRWHQIQRQISHSTRAWSSIFCDHQLRHWCRVSHCTFAQFSHVLQLGSCNIQRLPHNCTRLPNQSLSSYSQYTPNSIG